MSSPTWIAAALGLGALVVPLASPAATIRVDRANGAGLVVAAADGKCSLIEAIQAANSSLAVDTCPAGDKGELDPDTIVLPRNTKFIVDDTTTPVPYNNKIGNSGLPVITTPIIIKGQGSVVRRGEGAATFRLFFVNPNGKLVLDAVNLQNGRVSNQGGAIAIRGGMAVLRNLTIDGNACANDGCDGGGLYAQDATLTVSRVTIVNNAAKDAGGGVRIVRPVDVLIEHSTIAHNSAPIQGGGISINELPEGAHATIRSSTIADNDKQGLFVNGATANAVAVEDSLFAGNVKKECEAAVQVTSNGKPNVAQTASSGILCPTMTIGTNLSTKLGPLAYNGGPTRTMALLPGADAIDLASADCTANPGLDQRGVPQDVDGLNSELSTDPAARCDAGAYESTNVYDFGDAPAPYPTALVGGARVNNGGAIHELVLKSTGAPAAGAVYLGKCVDGEAAPVDPTATATSDDLGVGEKVIGTCANPGDDEDGVAMPKQLIVGVKRGLRIATPANQKAVLDAWLDLNRDGDWNDPGERIIDHRATKGGTQTLAGVLDIPAEATLGLTYARFRLSPEGVDSPEGFAGTGEVEDYRVRLVAMDTTPALLAFTAVNEAAAGSVVTSNVVTVKGINVPAAISITGGSYRIGNGDFTNVAGTVRNKQTIQLRANASATAGGVRRVKLTVGTRTFTWRITTAGGP